MIGCCGLLAVEEPGFCPICGTRGVPIRRGEVERLLGPEKQKTLPEAAYYACQTPECDIVYFNDLFHYFDTADVVTRPPGTQRDTR